MTVVSGFLSAQQEAQQPEMEHAKFRMAAMIPRMTTAHRLLTNCLQNLSYAPEQALPPSHCAMDKRMLGTWMREQKLWRTYQTRSANGRAGHLECSCSQRRHDQSNEFANDQQACKHRVLQAVSGGDNWQRSMTHFHTVMINPLLPFLAPMAPILANSKLIAAGTIPHNAIVAMTLCTLSASCRCAGVGLSTIGIFEPTATRPAISCAAEKICWRDVRQDTRRCAVTERHRCTVPASTRSRSITHNLAHCMDTIACVLQDVQKIDRVCASCMPTNRQVVRHTDHSIPHPFACVATRSSHCATTMNALQLE